MKSIAGILILGLASQCLGMAVEPAVKDDGSSTPAKPEAATPEQEVSAEPEAEAPPKAASEAHSQEGPSLSFLSEGTNHLSVSLLQTDADNRTNLVFSPLGYSVILALLAEGSRGKTRNQLTSFLHLPEDTSAYRSTYKSVLSLMQERNVVNKPEFRNFFYIYKNYTAVDAYKNVLRENYFTEVKEIDREPELSGGYESEESVEEQQEKENGTKPLDKVDLKGEKAKTPETGERKARNVEKEIMSAMSANRLSSSEDNSTYPESRMIVFNALYYRGKWARTFSDVEGGSEFECPDGVVRPVPSIQSSGEFEFGRLRQLRASAINIPYEGGRYSLLVILPDRGESLPSLLKRLPKLSLSQIDNQLTKRQVKVTLPKFRYYTITRPKAALLKEGVEDVFGENADLSGITGEKGLYLDDLVQLVTIEVTQDSSAYNFLTTTNLRSSVAEFTAQRPFLYLLRDRTDNFIVVAGKVEDPLAGDEKKL